MFLSTFCGATWNHLWLCTLPSTLVLALLSVADTFQLVFNTFTCSSSRQQIFTSAALCQVPAPGIHSFCTEHTWSRGAMHWQDWQCKLLQMLLALNPTWVPAYACQCPAASHPILQIMCRLSEDSLRRTLGFPYLQQQGFGNNFLLLFGAGCLHWAIQPTDRKTDSFIQIGLKMVNQFINPFTKLIHYTGS